MRKGKLDMLLNGNKNISWEMIGNNKGQKYVMGNNGEQ
jgi:hypothetical protein